jgi:hypothetical protein
MPTIMHPQGKTFDARPDRIDLRDRMYRPALKSLPDEFPSQQQIDDYFGTYWEKYILDQGHEGACTGFGLAATINYLLFRRKMDSGREHQKVSERMLYHMARIYDEWPGEDYEGSSCRGAMKGWHRHGVCSAKLWPYRNEAGEAQFVAPSEGWQLDAAKRPLGAYYRIDKASITDIQAAIYEVGAVYCSAQVHDGWFMDTTASLQPIPMHAEISGGHAFALVGYNQDGFIVQNSWGPSWGYHGFAVMTYQDWVANGSDAWVAVLGAPMRVQETASTFSHSAMAASAVGRAGFFSPGEQLGGDYDYKNKSVRPYSENQAYLHSLVLGNNGRALNKLLDVENSAAATRKICFERPARYLTGLADGKPQKIAIYVHGGLNNEADSIKRIRLMAPYFIENEIYPIFITWKTGILESLTGMLTDSVREIFQALPEVRDEGILDALKNRLAEARDRSIEVACENLLVKAIWAQMKQNAAAAGENGGGVLSLAAHLEKLKADFNDLEIHLVGHSAGSIVLGHLLTAIQHTAIASFSLFAPACTAAFANQHYQSAANRHILKRGTLHIDLMDDEREQADTVGPYGKSLLYLVSRALETRHKTPIIGMAHALGTDAVPADQWNSSREVRQSLEQWRQFYTNQACTAKLHRKEREYVPTGSGRIKLAHGSFDNDVEVIGALLKRIRGGELLTKVENLEY